MTCKKQVERKVRASPIDMTKMDGRFIFSEGADVWRKRRDEDLSNFRVSVVKKDSHDRRRRGREGDRMLGDFVASV